MSHILVVDDDKVFREFVSSVLKGGGHSVDLAGGGVEAMELFSKTTYDLLIVDVVMPDKGGIETMMDAHALKHDLPIIMVSGKVPTDTEAFRRLVQKFGGCEVLSKPFSEKQLVSAVTTALKQSSN